MKRYFLITVDNKFDNTPEQNINDKFWDVDKIGSMLHNPYIDILDCKELNLTEVPERKK